MILAFDIGNTNIVLGAIDNGEILRLVRMRTDAGATADEYAIKLIDMLHFMGREPEEFEGAVISTVVPQVGSNIWEAVRNVLGVDALIISDRTENGLEILLDDPHSVAGDLIVGAVAVKEYYGYPSIILDLGTATTMTVLDENGAYAGGAIIPGVFLGLNALSSGTALLPEISISAPERCIGTNTVDGMRSGAVFGNAALIDGMIDRMEAELGRPCRYVATGGLASSIVKNCRHEIVCDDDLLLKGLWAIYQMNRNCSVQCLRKA